MWGPSLSRQFLTSPPKSQPKTPRISTNCTLPLACALLMLITAVALRKALYPFKPQHICELANKLQA